MLQIVRHNVTALSVTQHDVETCAVRVVTQDGPAGEEGISGNADVNGFEDEVENEEIDVVVVMPECNTPADGGGYAEHGDGSPLTKHATTECARMGGVECARISIGAGEDGGEATVLFVEKSLQVVEGWVFNGCFSLTLHGTG